MALSWFAWNDLSCEAEVSRFVCSMHTSGANTDHTYKGWRNMERKDWDAYFRGLKMAECPWMLWTEDMDDVVPVFLHDECMLTAGAEDNWDADESGRWSAFNDWNNLCLYMNNDPGVCHKFERAEKHAWTKDEKMWIWNSCEDIDIEELMGAGSNAEHECYDARMNTWESTFEDGVWYEYSTEKSFAFLHSFSNWLDA